MMENDYFYKNNVFGKKIHFPISIFKNHPRLEGFIRSQLQPLFEKLEMEPGKAFADIVDTCNKHLEKFKPSTNGHIRVLEKLTQDAERELHRTFNFFDFAQNKRYKDEQRIEQLKVRAEKIYRQIREPIKKYLAGKEIKLLDMGCGDGLVTWALREHENDLNVKFKRTYLADLVDETFPDYRIQELKGNEKEFPFIPLEPMFTNLDIPNGKGPVRLDCILLLTVLHHSIDPRDVFLTCWRLLKENGIVIIIESCVGITSKFVKQNSNTEEKNIYSCNGQKKAVEQFLMLSDEEEIMYATFIDWFYNRVLHQDVLVTYNFNCPENWNEIFEGYHKMFCKETYCEGFDQLTVPEFHTLHVLRKESK